MEGFGFKKYLILYSILGFLKTSAMPTPQITTITKHSCWHSVSMAHRSFLLGTDTFTHKPRCGACKGNWCDLSTQRGGSDSCMGRKTVLLVCKTRPASVWTMPLPPCKFLPGIVKQLTVDGVNTLPDRPAALQCNASSKKLIPVASRKGNALLRLILLLGCLLTKLSWAVRIVNWQKPVN